MCVIYSSLYYDDLESHINLAYNTLGCTSILKTANNNLDTLGAVMHDGPNPNAEQRVLTITFYACILFAFFRSKFHCVPTRERIHHSRALWLCAGCMSLVHFVKSCRIMNQLYLNRSISLKSRSQCVFGYHSAIWYVLYNQIFLVRKLYN